MVTATTGVIRMRSRSGKELNASFYLSDVAAAQATFSLTGVAVAGSQNFLKLPAGETWTLIDLSMITGPTVITTVQYMVDGAATNKITAIANIVNTIQNRSFAGITVVGGTNFQMLQA